MTTVARWGRDIIIVGAAIWILISSGLYNGRLFVIAVVLIVIGAVLFFKEPQ